MERMIETLETFVALDAPFLKAERQARISTLQSMLVRADLSAAEQFRQVLEAYQIEVEYGRTIEAYRDTMTLDGEDHSLNFLRVGRIALLYLSDDQRHIGHWNARQRQWQSLPAEYARDIRQGLKIARKQSAPALLSMPVATPGAPS